MYEIQYQCIQSFLDLEKFNVTYIRFQRKLFLSVEYITNTGLKISAEHFWRFHFLIVFRFEISE